MFGDEANPYRALLDIKYPISEGVVVDREDFADLWRYALTKRMGVKE